MKFYHGTTFEAAEDILKNGFNTNSKNWSVSRDEIYFWNETDERDSEACLKRAYDVAVIAAACKNSKTNMISIICIDYDLPVHKDESCGENVEERVAAYVGNVNDIILKYPSRVSVVNCVYHPDMRARYLYNEYSIGGVRWNWLKNGISDIQCLENEFAGIRIKSGYSRIIQTPELSFENNRLDK